MSSSNKLLQGVYIYGIYIKFFQTRSGDFVGTPPQVRNISGGGARDQQCLRFRTFGNPEFKFYYDLFYPAHSDKGRKKRVAKNIH